MNILTAKDIRDNKMFLDAFRERMRERLRGDRTFKEQRLLEDPRKDVFIDIFLDAIETEALRVKHKSGDFGGGDERYLKANVTIKKYMMWIVQRYVSGGIRFFEDLNQTIEYLVLFDYYKRKGYITGSAKDIAKYKGFADLYVTVSDIEKEWQKNENNQMLEILSSKEANVIYEDNKYIVVIPRTFNAAKILGSDAWCTSRGKNQYREYTEEGPLYILLIKQGSEFSEEKYQFHFEKTEFTDKNNLSVNSDIGDKFPFLLKIKAFSKHPFFNHNLSASDQMEYFLQNEGNIPNITLLSFMKKFNYAIFDTALKPYNRFGYKYRVAVLYWFRNFRGIVPKYTQEWISKNIENIHPVGLLYITNKLVQSVDTFPYKTTKSIIMNIPKSKTLVEGTLDYDTYIKVSDKVMEFFLSDDKRVFVSNLQNMLTQVFNYRPEFAFFILPRIHNLQGGLYKEYDDKITPEQDEFLLSNDHRIETLI